MVLNDIIEQAAGRHSRASEHGGKYQKSNALIHLRMVYSLFL